MTLDVRHLLPRVHEGGHGWRQPGVPAGPRDQARQRVGPDTQLAGGRLPHGRMAQVERHVGARERVVQFGGGDIAVDRDLVAKAMGGDVGRRRRRVDDVAVNVEPEALALGQGCQRAQDLGQPAVAVEMAEHDQPQHAILAARRRPDGGGSGCGGERHVPDGRPAKAAHACEFGLVVHHDAAAAFHGGLRHRIAARHVEHVALVVVDPGDRRCLAVGAVAAAHHRHVVGCARRAVREALEEMLQRRVVQDDDPRGAARSFPDRGMELDVVADIVERGAGRGELRHRHLVDGERPDCVVDRGLPLALVGPCRDARLPGEGLQNERGVVGDFGPERR